ncbi:MAG: tryptophan-rich sensory protein [Chloroflexi bacterium AL-W]|nr:tryptophan-rich sensory protein [Chloroflexi bacterium AL-N1]NOK64803.1 tryptophan-rich sensory protein [Chloroflexi bacterium AL-N10]NOK76573.1 tryptophan-rich sensory protein [Chloroflexi bacterium AL-N5]NOK80197.1 tryptophan-rich sensory protein [Chloroflexi bacterium AL-W]NOK86710.1 tryptophan-rich sensory protein [Chloroflexi bacterium AL-N15]
MFQDRIRQLLVVVFAILQFVTPVFFGDIFDESSTMSGQPIYFVPAGYTFLIWSVIVFLSATYATYQILPGQTERVLHRCIGWYVMLNTLFFSLWLWAAAQQGTFGTPNFQPIWILLTVIIIIGMLLMNILAFNHLRALKGQLTDRDMWLVQVPVSVYFGWLSVATIANTTAYLYGIGWTGELWGVPLTVALLCVAAIITGSVLLLFNNIQGAITYGAIIIWATIGIALENRSQSLAVTVTAVLVAVTILLVTMYSVNRDGSSHGSEANQPVILGS